MKIIIIKIIKFKRQMKVKKIKEVFSFQQFKQKKIDKMRMRKVNNFKEAVNSHMSIKNIVILLMRIGIKVIKSI